MAASETADALHQLCISDAFGENRTFDEDLLECPRSFPWAPIHPEKSAQTSERWGFWLLRVFEGAVGLFRCGRQLACHPTIHLAFLRVLPEPREGFPPFLCLARRVDQEPKRLRKSVRERFTALGSTRWPRLESSLGFRGEEDAIRKGTIPRGTTPLN
jgi:hypothetical protein